VLLGQDKRELGALVFPDEEYLAATGADADAPTGTTTSSSSSKGLELLLFAEVSRLNKARPDYHPEDHIGHIQVRPGDRGRGDTYRSGQETGAGAREGLCGCKLSWPCDHGVLGLGPGQGGVEAQWHKQHQTGGVSPER
jgi:hypothetical protein